MTEQKAQPLGGWPRLRVCDWTPTRDTLHMWTQIAARSGWRMHRWSTTWQVTLYVSPRGLTTSAEQLRVLARGGDEGA